MPVSRFDVLPEVRNLSGMVDDYAELDVVSYLLQKGDAHAILERVSSEMLTTTKRGQIFEAVVNLVGDGVEITPTSVLIEARRGAIRLGETCEVEEGDLDAARKRKCGDLNSAIAMVVNAYRSRRLMVDVVMWAAERVGAQQTDNFADDLKQRVDGISLPPRAYNELMRGVDIPGLTMADQEMITQRWDSGLMADLSWPWLSMAGAPPILPGWFAIFAGLDGGMKTAFMESLLEAWCVRKTSARRPRCLYVHTEYDAQLMRLRRLARWSQVPLDRLALGNTTPSDRERVAVAVEKMRERSGLDGIDYLHFTESMSTHDILGYLDIAHKQDELDFVVIDYFGNINVPPAILRECGGDIHKATGRLSRMYQAFSERTKVPIGVVAQYTKKGMEDVESGKIASPSGIGGPASWMQRAQIQAIMHRPILLQDGGDVITDNQGNKTNYGKKDERSLILDIKFAKASVGRAGTYQLLAYPAHYAVGTLPPGSVRL